MQKQQIRENKMKKGLLALSAATLFVMTTPVQAKQEICVFDLLGRAGESYKLIEEWKLAAKNWQGDIELIPYQDEEKVEQDFDAGKCDGVYMTSMRARKYNKFAGSIDSLGGAPSNEIAQRAITYVLDARNAAKMTTKLGGNKYEIAGIAPLGAASLYTTNFIEPLSYQAFSFLKLRALS